MLESPRIVSTPPLHYAALRLTIPKAAIQREMGPGLRAVHAALAAQRVEAAGPWFTHHLRLSPTEWDFEIGVPVAAPIAPAGRVVPCVAPALRAVQATLRGGYEGLAAAWGAVDAWIAAQGLAPAEDLWEEYRVGPEASADPSAWRTELRRPLRSS
jgi:hypothetical protein